MPVVQMTVQVVAGPKFLGAAAASVQFSRSVGAAFGTALVGAVLFAVLAGRDPATGRLLHRPGRARAARAAGRCPRRGRRVVQAEIADAFRAAFLTIALFTTAGMCIAWWLPVRRI